MKLNIKRNIIIGVTLIIVPLIITAMMAAHNNPKNIDYPDGCHVRGGVVWYHSDHTNVSALKCMEDHHAITNKGIFVLEAN